MSKTNEKTDNYPTLSRPFESMKTEYDVIVIGSGYGAGVAASRMARAGKSVAVLELGWERRCTNCSLIFGNLMTSELTMEFSWVIPTYIHTMPWRYERLRNLR